MKVETKAGETFDLGATEASPTVTLKDYSRLETDDFGVTTVVRRGFSRQMAVRLKVPANRIDTVQRRLADLRATPARWVADARYAILSANGFYKDFALDIPNASIASCTLTVEGLAETSDLIDTGGDPAPKGWSSLQMLRPITVTNAVLVSSSVAETDHPTWSSGTSYGKGARVILAATHRIYESAVEGNVGNDPAGGAGKWLTVGPTNRWAMFDQALGSTTTAQGSIAVTLTAAAIGAIALLDVVGATVRVQTDSYDRTKAVGAGAITFLDLPSKTTRATVTITGPAAVSVGTLLAGDVVGLGTTEASPSAGITDYSRREVDEFGEVTVVPRDWAKKMTAKAGIATTAIDNVFARLAAVRATPVLWIGGRGLDALTIYGFFKSVSIEVGQAISKLSLSVDGLSTAGAVEPLFPGSGGSVAWPDITDPAGTKPTDNADKTSQNTSKDTAAVAGKPATQVISDITSVAARALKLETETIPAINDAVADAGELITAARSRADAAFAEAERVDERVTNLAAQGGGGSENADTFARSEIQRVEQVGVTDKLAIGRRVDNVSATIRPAGNWLNNTDLVTPDGWTAGANLAVATFGINMVGETYHPVGENVLSVYQAGRVASGSAYADWLSDPVAVQAGTFVQFSVLCTSDRADTVAVLGWLNVRGEFVGYVGGNTNASTDSFAIDPNDYRRSGRASVLVPEGAVAARLFLRKTDTYAAKTDSYAWFWRPYLGPALDGQTSWNPWSPGKSMAVQAATNARVNQKVTALASADEAFAERADLIEAAAGSLSARVDDSETALTNLETSTTQKLSTLESQVNFATDSGLQRTINARIEDRATTIAAAKAGAVAQTVSTLQSAYDDTAATVSQQAGTIVDLQGRSAAYLRLVADAGSGVGSFSLWSDQFGGAWELTGNGRIRGNLVLDGTLTGAKIASDAIAGFGNAAPGSLTMRDTALREAAGIEYPSNGGSSVIIFSGIVTLSPGAPAGTRLSAYLSIGGAIVVGPLQLSATRGSPVPFCFTTLQTFTGRQRVALSVQATNSVGSGDPHIIDAPTIVLTEFKKLGV